MKHRNRERWSSVMLAVFVIPWLGIAVPLASLFISAVRSCNFWEYLWECSFLGVIDLTESQTEARVPLWPSLRSYTHYFSNILLVTQASTIPPGREPHEGVHTRRWEYLEPGYPTYHWGSWLPHLLFTSFLTLSTLIFLLLAWDFRRLLPNRFYGGFYY